MKKLALILVSLSLLLAACSFDMTADLYMQDVMDAQELGETLFINGTLSLEFSGDEEERQQIVDILQDELNDVENVREEERSYSTYLVVDYKIPLIAAGDVQDIYGHPDVQDNIFTFAVSANTLNVAFNKPRFDQLDTLLYDQFYEHLDFEDFTMSLHLQNDLRDPVEVTLYSVYANNAPVPYSETFSLERRDEVEIRFSDVLRDSITSLQDDETAGIAVRKFAEFEVAEG